MGDTSSSRGLLYESEMDPSYSGGVIAVVVLVTLAVLMDFHLRVGIPDMFTVTAVIGLRWLIGLNVLAIFLTKDENALADVLWGPESWTATEDMAMCLR